jgi:dienelactone hydrolase
VVIGAGCLAGLVACGNGAAARPRSALSSAPAGVHERGPTKPVSGGWVHDVTYHAGDRDVTAYLLLPEGQGPFGAVLFAHWYTGRNGADRTEFLEEASALLKLGVVALLPQGQFPWKEDPRGVDHDRAAIESQVADLRSGLDVLIQQARVDKDRLAFVGHDYGAMHGALLMASDPRLKGGVLMAADAHWVTWFGTYWSFLKSDAQKLEYGRLMAPLDPISVLPKLPAALLLQFAEQDEFIPRTTADQLAAAVPRAASARFYKSDHGLNAEAAADRQSWLRQLLGLGQ